MFSHIAIARSQLFPTGVAGLDDIPCGGLPAHRQYLIEGMPGAGKTTLALQFLLEGRRRREPCLYITLSETKDDLEDVASSHGWSLEGIHVYELDAAESLLSPDRDYTVFRPEEVELSDTMRDVYRLVEELNPTRAVLDSLSELRLLAREPLRYRRQILGIKQSFAGRGCTVLLLDDKSVADADLQLQSISHGVVALERLRQEYGKSRRRLSIVKLRGAHFSDRYHDYTIETGGLQVYPWLVAAEHRHDHSNQLFSSGIVELDALLGGAIRAGTSTLIGVMAARVLAGDKWQENGLVFPSEIGTPLDERNVLRRFQAICEANDLPRLRVYDLRHTHASLLIHEGVHPKKISERLGHSSIKLTMDTYGHLFEGSDRDSADKMQNLLAPKNTDEPAEIRIFPRKVS